MSEISNTSYATRQTVVLLDPSIAITGAFKAAQNIARAVTEHYRVILILPAGSAVSQTELTMFTEVKYLPIPALRRSIKGLLWYLPLLVYSSWALHKILQRTNTTILHINDFYLLQGVIVRRLGFSGRIITMIRMDPWRLGNVFASFALQRGSNASDAMVVVSRYIQSLLPSHLRTVLLYDPVVNQPVVPTNLAVDRHRIVCIANYTRGKGQEDVLAAFVAVASAVPDITLEFHGGDLGLRKNREWRAMLEKRALASLHAERITFNGFAQDTSPILRGALASVNCSYSEAFSLSILEACCYGLPIIATECGGPAEIVVNGRTGYLVPVGDVIAISDAMLSIANDRAMSANMGIAGLTLVCERFSERMFRSTLLELYSGAVTGRASGG